jgi:hypothetical protein
VGSILVRTLETASEGLLVGVAATIAIGVVVLAMRRWARGLRPPIAGLAVAAGYIALIPERIKPAMWLGLALLLIPFVVDPDYRLSTRIGLVLPGAALIGFGTTPGPIVLDAAVTLAIAVGGGLAWDTADEHDANGTATLFLTLSTIGGWLDIPDVDRILLLLGVALPVTLLAWPIPLIRVGASAPMWVAVLIWTAVDGGAIRLSSVVGTSAALGLLLLEPLVRARMVWDEGVFVRIWGDETPASAIAPAAAQAAMVLLASRIAGLQRSTEVAVLLAVILLGVGFVALYAAARHLDAEYLELD